MIRDCGGICKAHGEVIYLVRLTKPLWFGFKKGHFHIIILFRQTSPVCNKLLCHSLSDHGNKSRLALEISHALHLHTLVVLIRAGSFYSSPFPIVLSERATLEKRGYHTFTQSNTDLPVFE